MNLKNYRSLRSKLTLLLFLLIAGCSTAPVAPLPEPLSMIRPGMEIEQIAALLPLKHSKTVRKKKYLALFDIQEASWRQSGLHAAYFYFYSTSGKHRCHAVLLQYRPSRLSTLRSWAADHYTINKKTGLWQSGDTTVKIDTNFRPYIQVSIDTAPPVN